ncbi:MAG: hypothetical protein FWC15_03480 [Fibromonadales bacterium]|nr:hypothetical protein [Fibromonadales bacterium]
MRLLIILVSFLAFSCSQKPSVAFVTPPPNPDAPLAYMGEGNLSPEMRHDYAAALQNLGLYNFATDSITEDGVKQAVEVRLHYEEPGKNVHILKAELLKNNSVILSTTLTEEGKNKKERRYALMERFLAEVKRRESE